jgi:hypothetical protein
MSDVAEQVYEQAPAINTNEIPVVDISGFAEAATPNARPSPPKWPRRAPPWGSSTCRVTGSASR